MALQQNKKIESIYWILVVLGVLIGIIFYGVLESDFSLNFLIFFSGVPFLLFVAGGFGLLWPRIKPTGNTTYITHAIAIGVIFFILFMIHTWVILPLICPEFGRNLGM